MPLFDVSNSLVRLGNAPVKRTYLGSEIQSLIPSELFVNGEQGVWYDPSDLSTLFQDTAGTIPVTGVEQPVGLMLDKSGRGNHASQPTTTARPILRALYNLLPNTVFAGAVSGTAATSVQPTGWGKVFWTAGSINVDNSASDLAITFSTTLGRMVIGYTIPVTEGQVYVCSADIEVLSGSYTAQSVIDFTGSGTGHVRQYFLDGVPIDTASPVSSGRLVCVLTVGSGVSTTTFRLGSGANASRTGVIKVSRPDVRLLADSGILPGYQRVTSATDYDTIGFPVYLKPDGVDDFMQTAQSVNLSGTAKMSAVVGVTKLTDASRAIVYEHGTSFGLPGNFSLEAPGAAIGPYFYAGYNGGSGAATIGLTGISAPATLVGTLQNHLDTPWRKLTVNKLAPVTNTVNNGAGPFASTIAYLFARTGTAFRFAGRFYGLLIVGRACSAGEMNSMRQYMRNKTRAY